MSGQQSYELRRNVAAAASRWRHCDDLTDPGIEPETSQTNSNLAHPRPTVRCLNHNDSKAQGLTSTDYDLPVAAIAALTRSKSNPASIKG